MESSDPLPSSEAERPRLANDTDRERTDSDDSAPNGDDSWTTFDNRQADSDPKITQRPSTTSVAPDNGTVRPEKIGRYRVRRLLGTGSFGNVWLADDDELQRQVAIKVPRAANLSGDDNVAQFLQEARTVAGLKHPGIVAVYDVGRTDAGDCFVVMEHIEGQSLADRLRASRLSFEAAAQLMERTAEAVHYAHTRGFVHRDLKPGNILLDSAGQPRVVDFGLALHEREQRRSRGHLAGSPPYMAPEQVRGEGHRLDGRTDIWALGVILYELVTGRWPFGQPTSAELFDEIQHRDPKPPRQIDDSIPIELERVSLKCLSKRMSDRYSTAADVAADLRLYRESRSKNADSSAGAKPSPSVHAAAASPDAQADSVRIVPKGLRSFDAHDADFFLKLLAGPVDREGLPESIRFWKAHIEASDPDRGFAVGLIYGPSGCGKSSLVKAGLMPRLSGAISVVYVEATREGTEQRLLQALRRQLPEEDRAAELVGAVAALRKASPGRKTLIVLDQFEQWLHARPDEADAELVRALRQCDGPHVQCLILVRDDFWLAVSRFMRELEIPLLEGQNSALVDLFDPLHARKVLSEFGRAFGRLPEKLSSLSADQERFLDEAVSGLSENGKVVSVRLALFAEMVKGKLWTPATLRAIGGAAGVGVAFLEETFSAATAPPAHRLHQQAARAALQALLPERGTEIKGRQRSRDELANASGYHDRPAEFEELMRILDGELRLVTPAVDEESRTGSASASRKAAPSQASQPREKTRTWYQLTHDYLVPSLRDWLTRKQRETRRGRAELRLAERTADWIAQPGRRRLPSFWEWAQIALWSRRRDWTDDESRLMSAAGRHHVASMLVFWAAVGFAGWGAWELNGQVHARAVREQLFLAKTADVPGLLPQVDRYRRWLNPLLESSLADRDGGQKQQLHARLALLRSDPTQADTLQEALLDASPEELPAIRDALSPHRESLADSLWEVVASPDVISSRRLRAACALAVYAPQSDHWRAWSHSIADWLLRENALQAGQWAAELRGVWPKLVDSIVAAFRDPTQPGSQRTLAANVLAYMSGDDTPLMASLVKDAQPDQLTLLLAALRPHAAQAKSLLAAQLETSLTPHWPDEGERIGSRAVAAATAKQIEVSDGLLDDEFAFTQTLPAVELSEVDAELQSSGYRLLCLRPFVVDRQTRVAALWTRREQEVKWAINLVADDVGKQGNASGEGFLPFDVACYATEVDDAPAGLRFAAVWVEDDPEAVESRFVLAANEKQYTESISRDLFSQGFTPRTQTFIDSKEGPFISAVWRLPRSGGRNQLGWMRIDEGGLDQTNTLLETDLRPGRRPAPLSIAERSKESLRAADAALRAKPDDVNSRVNRATALFWLERNEEAIADITELLKEYPRWEFGYNARAISYARLGRAEEARGDVDRFKAISGDADQKVILDAAVSGVLGDPPGWQDQLEAEMARRSSDARLVYLAATIYAELAKQAEEARREELVKGSLSLLRQAIEKGYDSYEYAATEPAMEMLWSSPDFQKLMWGDDFDVQFSAAGRESTGLVHESVYVRGTAQHLLRCRELAAAGYRPRSLSVAMTSADRPLMAASVWHRPVVSDDARDTVARQQAQAAVALFELDDYDHVWPLLGQTADPRRKTFLVHALSALVRQPEALAERLDTEPDPSARRALLSCLAERSPDDLRQTDRKRLLDRMLALYQDDPDPGVHGAAELLLRRWQHGAACEETIQRLKAAAPSAERKWYVNQQGQTYVVVDGPIDFVQGSPSYEPGRKTVELAHARRIPRSFAIAAKEVTVAEFHRFQHEHPQAGVLEAWEHSPEENCPMIPLTWFQAAQYCRWLSEQEGLPEEEMCYPKVSEIKAGMTMPNNFLSRMGYRLPTEAEWECACRAGTKTARPYGSSDELLDKYAWYLANSQRRAWPVGSLFPNDWGCFDMLGNALEWCHDRNAPYQPARHGAAKNDHENTLTITGDDAHILRGGSFEYPAEVERSAQRLVLRPGEMYLYISRGLRPARTVRLEKAKAE